MVGMTSVVVTVMIVIGCMTIMTDSISRLMGLVCFFSCCPRYPRFFVSLTISSLESVRAPVETVGGIRWRQLQSLRYERASVKAGGCHIVVLVLTITQPRFVYWKLAPQKRPS